MSRARTSRGKITRSRGVRVKVVCLAHARGLALPAYQSAGAAGLDLVAALGEDERVKLRPRARVLVPTGLVMELPAGYEAQVRPRSGLAARHGITVLNSPGTIDSDYRGEVKVLLVNLGEAPFAIVRGDRIAQMVIQPVARASLVEVRAAKATARGAGGFGSTGTGRKKRPAKAAAKAKVRRKRGA